MNDPWLPPYLGSWEELVNAELHNPFLGSGSHGRPPSILSEEMRMAGPIPVPWRMGPSPDSWHLGPIPLPWRLAVSYLVSTISLKEAASHLQDEQLKKELTERAELSISRFIDDYCGTGRSRPHIPRPWPGPPPWIQPTVSALVMVAHSYSEGNFRNEILNVAGALTQAAFTARE